MVSFASDLAKLKWNSIADDGIDAASTADIRSAQQFVMLVWMRPVVIVGAVVILLTLNAREFKSKRRALEAKFPVEPVDDAAFDLARHQALQALTNEQLLHMIHTMLAAILAALLWP